MLLLGVLGLLCYGVHAAFHVARGHGVDALWACHVATLLVSAGALAQRPRLAAVGVLWLAFGNAVWLVDLATGGEFFPTSLLTHVGGFAIGLVVLKRRGWPASSWWPAALGFLGLLLLTRLVTPRADNVNLAFSVSAGWEAIFPSYPLYLALLVGAGTLTFFVAELGLRRLTS
jgi:hypothetical protein